MKEMARKYLLPLIIGILMGLLVGFIIHTAKMAGDIEPFPYDLSNTYPLDKFYFMPKPDDSTVLLMAIEKTMYDAVDYYLLPMKVKIVTKGYSDSASIDRVKERQVFIAELPDFMITKIDSIMKNEILLLTKSTGVEKE